MFDRLGIGDAVRALGSPWDEAGLRRADGGFLVRYSVEQFSRHLGEPTIGVHRGELQAVLLRALDPDIVTTGATCTGLHQHKHGVTVELADGALVEASVVVGADGRRSVVRRELFGDHPSRGRVTLLGDAAHPMTPDLGQGACQAILDAWVLAEAGRVDRPRSGAAVVRASPALAGRRGDDDRSGSHRRCPTGKAGPRSQCEAALPPSRRPHWRSGSYFIARGP